MRAAAVGVAAAGGIAALIVWRRRRMGPAVFVIGQGWLHGETIDGVARFLGIPFAGSPAGEHRWRPPRPAPSWSLPRCNPQVLCRSLQPNEGWNASGSTVFGTHRVSDSEEGCLALNVWTPEGALDASAPLRPYAARPRPSSHAALAA